MLIINRRNFIQSSACLLAMAITGTHFGVKKRKPLLSFSTLGCPDWSFEKILNFAAEHKFDGIEIRGILRQLDLTKCDEFSSADKIKSAKKMVREMGLKITDLGSSAAMHHGEGEERIKNLEDGKRFIDLAQELSCPYVRVFPNNFPKDKEHNAVIDLIVNGLTILGDHAKGSGVKVLMETHGDVVKTADILKIMQQANHSRVGLIWDIVNMWSISKEPPAMVFKALQPYIYHTHIKDATLANNKLTYTFIGKGETPIFEAVDILRNAGYKGFYSFEWEKLWHPEIAEPEVAIADYVKVMRQHFS